MSARRVASLATCLVVAGLAGWFAVARWDQASRVATEISALGAVAVVGVAVWAALPRPDDERTVRVSDTGSATAGRGGRATSGLTDPGAGLSGRIEVERTGPADASGGGTATTGADLS
jgi:hypothetical protein